MYWWNQGRRTMSGRRALTYRPAAGKQAQTHTCVGDADGFFHLLPLVWETSSNNVAKYCYQLPDGKLLAVLGVPKVVAVAAAEERGRLVWSLLLRLETPPGQPGHSKQTHAALRCNLAD